MIKLYYLLTAYFPRKLPHDFYEFEHFKHVLVNYYGLTDDPLTWATVAGQMSSHNPRKARAPWGEIANAVKHLEVVKLAKSVSQEAQRPLEDRMKALAEKQEELANEVTKLLSQYPVETSDILAGDENALRMIATKAMEMHPAEGTLSDWVGFIKGIALQENVSRASAELEASEPESVH